MTKMITAILASCMLSCASAEATSMSFAQMKALYVGKKISVTENALGCRSYYKLHDLLAIQDSADKVAFIAFVKNDANGCIVARKGIVAYVQERRERRSYSSETTSVCARPEGFTSCVWFAETSVEPLD